MSISVIVDDGNLCGESPVWRASEQRLYWTDSAGRKFYSYDWKTKRREILLDDFEVSGFALDRSGGFTFINSAGVWLWNKNEPPIQLVNALKESKLQLNDCIADPEGRLLAGSCFYDGSVDYPLGKLFCVQSNGSVQILDEGFHLANGLGFSPDAKTLYFTDSVARTIFVYSYDPVNGRAHDRRVFVKVDGNSGLPDGLTVDAGGFVWSAEWYGGCISRYDPDGKLERRIQVPAKQTSSLAFGGPELDEIYVTTAAMNNCLMLAPEGYDPSRVLVGGALYRFKAGIRGKVKFRSRVRKG